MPHPDKIYAQQLVDFCYESPTAFHAVASSKKILEENGFKALDEADDWQLERGGKYYFVRNDSAFIANGSVKTTI